MDTPTPPTPQQQHDEAAQRLDAALKNAAPYGVGVDMQQAAFGKLLQEIVGAEGSDAWLLWHADLYDRLVEGLPAVLDEAQAQLARAKLTAPARNVIDLPRR